MPPHDDRAAGPVRPSGERLRRHRFQRAGPHRRSRRRGARADARDRRHALPADAHHVVVRPLRGERTRARAHSRIPRLPGIHMEGPVPLAGGRRRAARIRARTSTPASVDDFKPPPGRRRRPDRARHARAGSAGRDCRSSSISSRPACASPSATRPRRPSRSRDAVAAGATLATHLGNGCAQMLPRHPNVIWELLAADARVRQPDRGRPPPAAGDGQIDDPREGPEPDDSRHRRDRRRRHARPGRYTIGGVDVRARRRTAASSLPGHAVPRRLEPDAAIAPSPTPSASRACPSTT